MVHDQIFEDSKSKFLVTDSIIEISGSEDFVSQQIETLRALIMKRLERPVLRKSDTEPRSIIYLLPQSSPISNVSVVELRENLPSAGDLENVFITSGQSVSIVADIPGTSTSQRMINLVLIYLYAKLKVGIEEVSFKELRDVCEKYGEVDKTNFSKIINQNRRYFLTSGESKSQFAKLIRPGIKAAESLIAELN